LSNAEFMFLIMTYMHRQDTCETVFNASGCKLP